MTTDRRSETKCRRCGRHLRTDEWGRWIDRWGWQACVGDQPHDPPTSGGSDG